jgi:enamine deaminase RidA (YjgF/YER057c/UK114 family)
MPASPRASAPTATPWKCPRASACCSCPATPGLDPATGKLPESFSEQAEFAWRNLRAILAQAGMGVEDLVKLTQTLVRREDLAAYRDIRSRNLGAHRPASMLVFVPGLVWPDMLLELEAVAAR